jgi:hypothetical protein
VDFRRCLATFLAVFPLLWLFGCRQQKPQFASLTLKSDGSHISGTVVRRETNSITITDASGSTHTYLYSELSQSETAPRPTAPSGSASAATQPATGAAQPVAAGSILLPVGIELPVVIQGMIDSGLPTDTITSGKMNDDVKAADGHVLIPEGANVTILVREEKVESGRIKMLIELGSADFYNRHYVISSAKGWQEPGAVFTLLGAQPGTQQVTIHGANAHLEFDTVVPFRTETPTLLKATP